MGNDAYIAEVPNLRWKGVKVGKRAYRSRLEILWLMFDGLGVIGQSKGPSITAYGYMCDDPHLAHVFAYKTEVK